jgi:hypothetical protein
MLSGMKLLKFLQRKRLTDEEMREQEESRVRAAAELRAAEQDSERSRAQSKVPGPMRNSDLGGGW